MEIAKSQEVEAYKEAGRALLKSCDPIADYFWMARLQTLKDRMVPKHQGVIAPSDQSATDRLYAASSIKFPGWFITKERYLGEGQGIAIARFSGVSETATRGEFVGVHKKERLGPYVLFPTTPEEILLLQFTFFRLYKDEKDHRRRLNRGLSTRVSGVGIVIYSKSELSKMQGSSSGLNLDSNIAASFWGEKGQNYFKDSFDVHINELNWPVIIYDPIARGTDPFDTSEVFGKDLPKNLVSKSLKINEIANKWLSPFKDGVREVASDGI